MNYDKCPKKFYTNISDKTGYANSADPDQIPLSTLRNNNWKGKI